DRTEQQRRQMHDGLAQRDETIRRLNDQLGEKATSEQTLRAQAAKADNFLEVIRELEKHLDAAIARRQFLEQRADLLAAACEQAQAECLTAENERDLLREELASVEARFAALLQPEDAADQPLDLGGRTLLYVGGHTRQVAQLRALVERTRGQFLHHDA